MEKWAGEFGSWHPLTVEVFFAGMTGRPITSSSNVFTNPESTKPDFFPMKFDVCKMFKMDFLLRIKIDHCNATTNIKFWIRENM